MVLSAYAIRLFDVSLFVILHRKCRELNNSMTSQENLNECDCLYKWPIFYFSVLDRCAVTVRRSAIQSGNQRIRQKFNVMH